MNIAQIIRLATTFESKAQVMELGTSQMTRTSIQNKMQEYKALVEPVASQSAFYENWFGNPPGSVVLEVINTILQGGSPSKDMIALAVEDIQTNIPNINAAEFKEYAEAYSSAAL